MRDKSAIQPLAPQSEGDVRLRRQAGRINTQPAATSPHKRWHRQNGEGKKLLNPARCANEVASEATLGLTPGPDELFELSPK